MLHRLGGDKTLKAYIKDSPHFTKKKYYLIGMAQTNRSYTSWFFVF